MLAASASLRRHGAARATVRAMSTRVLSDFTIYPKGEGEAAMQVQVRRPTLRPLNNGFATQQRGVVLLNFAHRAPEGNRFDWQGQRTFLLGPLDTARLLHLPPLGELPECNMRKALPAYQGAGRVCQFQVVSQGQYNDVRISLTVSGNENTGEERFDATASAPEMTVLQELLRAAIPKMYAWDLYLQEAIDLHPKSDDGPGHSPAAPQRSTGQAVDDTEWPF